MSVETYLVTGKVLVRPYGSDEAFTWVGLCEQFSLAINQSEVSLPNRVTPGGGNYDSISRIASVQLTIEHSEFRPEVLARALYGEKAAVNGASIVAEQHEAAPDGYIQLAHPGPYTALTVTDDSTAPVAISPDQYELTAGGIHILEDADEIEEGDIIKVSYTHPAYVRVEALTGSAPELEIHFIGQNEADDSYPRNAKFYKVKLSAAADLPLLSSDDFSKYTLTGQVLLDTTKSSGGGALSQYFKLDQVPAPAA